MAEEFTPITTQEQFDSIIGSRLERERAKYSDYDTLKADVETKNNRIKELESSVTDLTGKLSKAETDSVKTRIAHELGLPFEAGQRLKGTKEDEIRKDAEALKALFGSGRTAPPYRAERKPAEEGSFAAEYAELARNISGEE